MKYALADALKVRELSWKGLGVRFCVSAVPPKPAALKMRAVSMPLTGSKGLEDQLAGAFQRPLVLPIQVSALADAANPRIVPAAAATSRRNKWGERLRCLRFMIFVSQSPN